MPEAKKSAPKKSAAPKKPRVKKAVKDSPELTALVNSLEAVGLPEFMKFLSNPKRLIWLNFLSGMAKGLGVVVGMTIVVGLLVWLLTILVDFPLIGEYFQELLDLLESQAPASMQAML